MMTASQLRQYAEENNIPIPNDKGADTNWAKETQRTGFATNHNLSISGGTKSTSYNASVNYIKRDGIIKGVGNNLFTARAYVETKLLKDRLLLGAGVNGNIRNESGVPATSRELQYTRQCIITHPLNRCAMKTDRGIPIQMYLNITTLFHRYMKIVLWQLSSVGK